MANTKSIAVGAACVALLAGCGSQQAQSGQQPEQRTLTVLAAASLTESFDELAARFGAEHPGAHVQFDYQGSSTLSEQLRQGRQADIFASADQKNMDKVVGSGIAEGAPETLVTNRLTIVVPEGNPKRITSLADLNAPGRTVVVCAAPVPCGAATEKVEKAAGLQLKPASEENDVKSVLRKVQAGEADAGLVYVTDASAAAGKVDAVDFPESAQAINTYPITTLKNAPERQLADEFLAYVRGPAGREVFQRHGFGAP